MKTSDKLGALFWFLIIIIMIFFLTSCSKIIYVPVESTKTEYVNKFLRDSIYFRDSISVKEKGDSIWIYRDRYLYRDKIIRDSIFKTDSIQVPYPVVEYKEINKLTGLQSFQIWCGRIFLFILTGYFVFRWIRKK